jgi:hypothetical protein
VLLLRRPGSADAGRRVYRADAAEDGGTLRRLDVEGIDQLATVDLEPGEPCDGPLVLVCAHGRRDPCCARLGPPVYDALREHVDPDRVWQSSHQGGHRFAPNVLVLPWGVQLGRVGTADVVGVATALHARRIPLAYYRGRTLHPPHVQAADVAIRRARGLDRLDDVRLLSVDGARIRFATTLGEDVVVVEERPGPSVSASCGGEAAPTVAFAVLVVSSA